MKKYAIGIDIGGTNTQIGFVDRKGNILVSGTLLTSAYNDVKEYLHALLVKINKLKMAIDITYQECGIGIGAPNGNFYKGTIEFAPNLKWKGVVPLVDLLKEHYSGSVVLTNDANAAAIGEMLYGGAMGMKDFILITLGTGLGSGIVVNGDLVYGHDGFAGEIGHTIVDPEGRMCGCGRKGCLETYASATGIRRTVWEWLQQGKESVLNENIKTIGDISGKKIEEAALSGDALAQNAFDFTGRILGLKLADAIAHTSPEAIFLFGGLAQAGDLIFEPVKRYMESFLLHIYKNKVKLLPSSLPGADAAVMGSSALVWKEISP